MRSTMTHPSIAPEKIRVNDRRERRDSDFGADLYWIPLGAGGWFVQLNGRVYEAVKAILERRRPLDLYHSALEVRLPEGRFVIENAWPIPDLDGRSRGAVAEGPVFSRWAARLRFLRYEVRRWRDGTIPDLHEAVEGPQRVTDDPGRVRRLLELVDQVPILVWGRDELGAGEMWNSNSVISWLLTRSGIPAETLLAPAGGRAPGWGAGLLAARCDRLVHERERALQLMESHGQLMDRSGTSARVGISRTAGQNS